MSELLAALAYAVLIVGFACPRWSGWIYGTTWKRFVEGWRAGLRE